MGKLPCEETLEDVCRFVENNGSYWVQLKDYSNVAVVNFSYLRKLEDAKEHTNQQEQRTYCRLEGKCPEMTCIGDECKYYQF